MPRCRLRAKKVCNLFHVDLQKRDCNPELCVARVFTNVLEELVHRAWNYTCLFVHFASTCDMLDSCARSKDAVRFARSCLTVCHYRAVEAIKYVFDHGLRSELGCRLLGVILVKHTVESKLALVVTRPQEGDSHLIRMRVYALYASLRSLT